MTPVRRLDQVLIDRIAAGEVIERPAAAVKELLENALDAGASDVRVTIRNGGRSLIRVVDNGHGMSAADLALAVERHATSKLPDGDLFDIRTLGFRGEALPSIGAIARLAVISRQHGSADASHIIVDAGVAQPVGPVAGNPGTRIEVTDLFAYTPARLKFLKSDRAEAMAVGEAVKRLALSHPHVRFVFESDGAGGFDYPAEEQTEDARAARLARIAGRDFLANALPVLAVREGLQLEGYAGLPTFHRGTSAYVFFDLNGRPLRDKLLLSAVRGAYADVLPGDRHPILSLSLSCDPRLVDVNVHPAKSEVRFRDPAMVRGLVVSALKEMIARSGHRATSTGGLRTLDALRGMMAASVPSGAEVIGRGETQEGGSRAMPLGFARNVGGQRYAPSRPAWGFAESPQTPFAGFDTPSADARAHVAAPDPAVLDQPLGAARAQLHETYIIAQTRDGLVIVDQHAAHERIVYEKLKRERELSGISRQMLLVPEVIELEPAEVDRLSSAAEDLVALGLVLEPFGAQAVLVRETPSLLKNGNVQKLVRDVADALAEHHDVSAISRRLDHVLATMACHNSVRAGRRMRPEEMDALLREMEITPNAGQCNHGRPTYVELKLSDVERLFGRK
jgi:DNA mismatch repair protein MutL